MNENLSSSSVTHNARLKNLVYELFSSYRHVMIDCQALRFYLILITTDYLNLWTCILHGS